MHPILPDNPILMERKKHLSSCADEVRPERGLENCGRLFRFFRNEIAIALLGLLSVTGGCAATSVANLKTDRNIPAQQNNKGDQRPQRAYHIDRMQVEDFWRKLEKIPCDERDLDLPGACILVRKSDDDKGLHLAQTDSPSEE